MPLIIPIFINQKGCKNRCIFCNARITGGEETPLNKDALANLVQHYLKNSKNKGEIEIAVYGGNFTGLPPQEQENILLLLKPFVEQKIAAGIRISTRPDEIDEEKIGILTRYHVTTVELGAQSLDDEILKQANRGHTAEDVIKATGLLKARGFQVGLHLMLGLPGDSLDRFMRTVAKVAEIAPHLVRLHPTVVLAQTALAEDYEKGLYHPLSLEEAVDWAARAVKIFESRNIRVIRLGLQATETLMKPGNIVAGPFHPAFGELVKSKMLRDYACFLLASKETGGATVTFQVPRKIESAFRGKGNENLRYLKEAFHLTRIDLIRGDGREIHLLDH